MKREKANWFCMIALAALAMPAVLWAAPLPRPSVSSWQDLPADRAYDNGYNSGYQLGQADRRAGRQSDFSRLLAYRRATSGWDPSQGSRDEYRQEFRAGFRDGYHDGYAESGGPESGRTVHAVPSPPPVSPMREAADEAFGRGYREGYRQGRADQGGTYDATRPGIYRDADQGYDASRFPTIEDYRFNFRAGFEAGYDDGYHGRPSDPRREALRTFSHRRASRGGYAPGPALISVPEGTVLHLRLNNTLSTRSSRQGDRFTTTVTDPVYTANSNEVAIPAGSTVTGVVSEVERAGRISGTARMHLRYESLILPEGAEYQLNATTAGVESGKVKGVEGEEGTVQGKRSTGREIGTVAAGGALGAIIGGIAGGGKGAGIGAAVGSAVGLGGVLATRGGGTELDLPNGTSMEVRLDRPLELRR